MARTIERTSTTAVDIARIAAGCVWLGGAAFNALWTIRQSAPYEWLEEETLPLSRWFFGDVVSAHPAPWTALLIAGELALGILTLARGRWARLGLAGGALFSALLFATASPYTLVMGPYAFLLAWLAWKTRDNREFNDR
jgi:hypothetical protein